MKKRIVLACSGGARSLAAIPWLADIHHAEVVAVALDLGQGDDLADVRERALSAGATRCHVVDVRDEFARDFVLPSVKAGALAEGRYPMATPLTRPLIAKTLIDLARIEGATAVAHGGRAADRMRFEAAIKDLAPDTKVIASDSVDATDASDRRDRNLWGTTTRRRSSDALDESGLDDMTSIADREATLVVRFEQGVPVALNGVPMPIVELIESLSTIGDEHRVGRLVRARVHGSEPSSVTVYDAPAAVVLHLGHDALEQFAVPASVHRFLRTVSQAYVDLIDRGEWFSALRSELDAFVTRVQPRVSGEVRLSLFRGSCRVTLRRLTQAETVSGSRE